ncbi:MAG: precorrin-6A synthase (deacetylating) [Nocardioidaceae bacterium]
MRRLRVVGIGPGGPDQLTVEAVAALNEVEVFLVLDKGAGPGVADLAALRTQVLERHVRGGYRVLEVPDPPRDRAPADYLAAVRDWHEARAVALEDVVAGLPEEVGGFLVWGDPALYDSTLRVVETILARGRVSFDYDVVPGLGAVSLLAARHRLVLNTVGAAVVVTTGRRLLADVAAGGDNLVVLLDGSLACRALDGDAWDLWWGANLGTPDEALVAGRLGEALPAVETARAAARAARGWVMDTYLLRRR